MRHAPLTITYAELAALKFPANEPNSRAVVVWLHGVGERGADPSVVANYGLPAALASGRAVSTCDVLCPQLPEGGEWNSHLVRDLILHAKPSYDIVVLIGYSLGGLGVFDSVADFGAACALYVSIAGRTRRVPTTSQVGVHLLSIQGEHDLQPEVSRFVNLVRSLGGIAEEAIIKGGNHYISESALWQPELQAALSVRGIGLHAHAA
jgi:predicted esterase